MGQQPNVPITIADLPRSTPKPAAPDGWRPSRPGDFSGPDDVPWGSGFGTPGPDAGYALKLIRERDLPVEPGLRRDAEAALLAVTGARASAMGRAPVGTDVDAAITLLDLGGAGGRHFAGIAGDHGRLRELVESIPRDRLLAPFGDAAA